MMQNLKAVGPARQELLVESAAHLLYLEGGLMGKAKPAKHTAAEIKAKVAAATTNKGGGNAGKEDRLGGKAGHAKYKCPVCAQQAPDMKTMQIHFEAKHPKLPWEQDKIIDMHALVGATTQGVAVRGSTKKK